MEAGTDTDTDTSRLPGVLMVMDPVASSLRQERIPHAAKKGVTRELVGIECIDLV